MHNAAFRGLLTVVLSLGVGACAADPTDRPSTMADGSPVTGEVDGERADGADEGRASAFGEANPRCRSLTDQVVVGYEIAFRRLPDTKGYDYWFGQLKGGMKPFEMLDRLLDSPELITAHANLDASGFVRQMFKALFDRSPNAFEYGYWGYELVNKGRSRNAVARDLAHTQEFTNKLTSPSYSCFF